MVQEDVREVWGEVVYLAGRGAGGEENWLGNPKHVIAKRQMIKHSSSIAFHVSYSCQLLTAITSLQNSAG